MREVIARGMDVVDPRARVLVTGMLFHDNSEAHVRVAKSVVASAGEAFGPVSRATRARTLTEFTSQLARARREIAGTRLMIKC